MKSIVSALAVALTLAFTVPAFPADVTTAKTSAECHKVWGHVGRQDQELLS